jgi:sugar (pentulose or hexulose) kinase
MDTKLDMTLDLTLVIDIGKSNAKLLLLDGDGNVVERHSRANASVTSPLGYPSLDVHGLQAWMQQTLRASHHAKRCGHVIASTHGAAIVALGDRQLAWAPLDYEFEDVALEGAAQTAFLAASGSFRETLSPELPAGLNAARQLHWMQHTHPEAWRRTRTLLPYAQYWAWLLSGVACSEVSSLGCHTHLWSPQENCFSSLPVTKGWAALFAPLRPAWDVVGTVGTERAAAWGLSPACQVHVGVHDSNACLARYFDSTTTQDATAAALTIVSSGTWTVLMAPGASAHELVAEQDMLGNVDVTGRITPTARFMGGREFAVLLEGADPSAASLQTMQQLVQSQTFALPCFSPQGGPFAGRMGYIEQSGMRLQGAAANHLNEAERATLAACYCAQVTAWLIHYLWKDTSNALHTVVVEGPLAHNPVYLQVLQAVLPRSRCQASVDALEGTARGAWLLTRWGQQGAQAALERVEEMSVPWLQRYHGQWLRKVSA